MVSIVIRLFAGLMLLPPFTPIGLALWWYAHRKDKAAKQRKQQTKELQKLNR